MKKLFIIILLLIIAGLISPKFIGSVVESEHQSVVNKLNDNQAITVNSTSITRSWFTGKAETEITISLQDEGLENISFIVEENLAFGPVIFTDEGVEFALSYSQASINFKELLIDEEIETFINDKIHFSGLLTFSKDVVANIVVDEVSKEIDGNKVTSAKAFGHFTLEDSKRLYGDFNWSGLTAKTSDESFTLGKLQFSLDQTLIAGDYFQGTAISTGKFDFSLDSIAAKDTDNNAVFSLDDILINAVSALNDDLMTVTMKYRAGKVEFEGQKLEDANLTLLVSDLNIIAMQEINTILAEISVDGAGMFTPDVMQRLTTLIDKLLVDKPVIEVEDFSVKTQQGDIASSMHISIDENLFDTTNIMSIIPAIKVDAKGKAPMPFFDELGVAPMVDLYIEEGYVVLKEDELSFIVNFAQGSLKINDRVIPM
ncbi:DUF945 family protein [Colwellia sp. 4_MG-2023]|jgi:uncharacterized protein YdgA (DUF945 family)|uniref:DUF945 family protein n=1 Tax=unclassified Colwellia TaxID=196834 RepID=UPI001C07FA16|nr:MULTISPECIES: DUF945 family protein [unclassified Colwellia]MBU2924160.1 YdgA family protein [Colwellia sp. C2M11]MDO6506193.1 DUF945 family protein [Colwellia sp. 5_MG-2023]MDO6554747.1 DUF945 family protein [Colwellia sp. 4_MG-2023]MDO6652050.1 DUF945 family protein [Colwellia sp. 3_MG-2023]MDO6664826.1 DUF945 family protein [Colwellia sp. 2_MG-2023]